MPILCSAKSARFLPLILLLAVAPFCRLTAAESCSPLPQINPHKDFVANFNNPCYAIRMAPGTGANELGDLNATYDQIYYQIMPGYDLVILGEFPNARFMSATAYDDHLAATGPALIDYQILPLTNRMLNPYLVGATYVSGQQYGIAVDLGFGQPVTEAAGCRTTGTTIDKNILNASQIHSGLTWLGYPDLPPDFPVHEIGANDAGELEIRRYIDLPRTPLETVIVRQLSNGCAISAAQAIALNILSTSQPNPSPWLHETQINAHQEFSQSIVPELCYPTDPLNSVTWLRTRDYIPLDNTVAAGIQATVQSTWLQSLVAGQRFIRVQFPMPTVPDTPCATGACALTGNEQLRYFSFSFQNGTNTLYSLKDSDFVLDPLGNATLIVSLGGVPPPQVNAANYYTYLDLTQAQNYAQLQTLFVRNMLPNAGFQCSSFNVPFYTMEYNSVGGFMGQYQLTVDYPTAAEIPTTPVPPVRVNSCALVPPPPTICHGQ